MKSDGCIAFLKEIGKKKKKKKLFHPSLNMHDLKLRGGFLLLYRAAG